MNSLLRVSLALTLSAIFLSVPAKTFAAIIHLNASLDGLQETPPVSTTGTGFADFYYDDVTNTITSGTVTFSGLIGTPSNAHIHGPALPGVSAGVIVGLPSFLSPIDLTGIVIPAAHEANLMNGLTYFNIHSTFRPGGEIRGQIEVVPEPSTVVLLAIAGCGLGITSLRRRRARSSSRIAA